MIFTFCIDGLEFLFHLKDDGIIYLTTRDYDSYPMLTVARDTSSVEFIALCTKYLVANYRHCLKG